MSDDEPSFELTDSLDLHTFAPRDCADVVAEYLHAAHARGFTLVRIIHGKGTGTMRRIVCSVLEQHPLVASFRQADANWGATLVELIANGEPG